LQNFRHWTNDYLGRKVYPSDADYAYADLVVINGIRLAILGLNTAVMCIGGDEEGKLLLGTSQIYTVLDHVRELMPQFSIALAHHPLSWLASWDRTECKELLTRHCNFLLNGHEHETYVDSLGPSRRCAVIRNGACDEAFRLSCAYNL